MQTFIIEDRYGKRSFPAASLEAAKAIAAERSAKLGIEVTVLPTCLPAYGEAEAGCWFDGSRGIYVGQCVINTAIANGWTPVDAGENFADPDAEFYLELWQEAEAWMDLRAADDFWFGSNENGDWGLWPVVEWIG